MVYWFLGCFPGTHWGLWNSNELATQFRHLKEPKGHHILTHITAALC